MRAVLLDVMLGLDRDLGLIWPGTAEVPRSASKSMAQLRIDEELWQVLAVREPVAVTLDQREVIRGLAVEHDLARPYQRRPACLDVTKWRPIDGFFFVMEAADDPKFKQHLLDEEILLQHHAFAFGSPQRLEDLVAALG